MGCGAAGQCLPLSCLDIIVKRRIFYIYPSRLSAFPTKIESAEEEGREEDHGGGAERGGGE